MPATMMPTRTKKNDGAVRQKSDGPNSDGPCADTAERIHSATPPAPNHAISRRSDAASRVRSMSTPIAAPANTKPAHGKNENVVRPANGRR